MTRHEPTRRLPALVTLLLVAALVASFVTAAPASALSIAQPANSAISLDATAYPEYKVFQRDNAGNYPLELRGSIAGPCNAVEASFAGRPFVTIDSAPTTTFTGSLLASTGQGMITVRCTNNRVLGSSVRNIGIGDVYVVAGQSNAEGHGIHAQSYSTIAGNSAIKPTVFTEADHWKLDNDQTDIHSTGGSVWPIVGGYVVAHTAAPVAFITTASGGSKLVSPNEWQPNGAVCQHIGVNCYNNMVAQVADAGVNGIKAVLWFQGEGDARVGQTQQAYNAALDQLAVNVGNDLPGSPPLVAGVIGPWISGGAATDNVRFATMEAWADNPLVLAGPQSYDIRITGDGFFDDKHFATNDEFQTLGFRWWKAIDAHFYSGDDGRGPVATTASVDASGTSIDVTFSDASGLAQPPAGLSAWAWSITDSGANVPVSSASVISSTVVRLVPATALTATGTISVTLARQNNGEGAIVPSDRSTGNLGLGPAELPADPFRDLVATRANGGGTDGGSAGGCGSVGFGSFGFGVAARDEAVGSGFVMFSDESVFSRFGAAPPFGGAAEHFVAVVFDEGSGVWRYDRNGALEVFVPRSSDVLVASVDFGSDVVVMLAGQGSSVLGGVTVGYVSSDLVVTANRWQGRANAGEFGLAGTSMCV